MNALGRRLDRLTASVRRPVLVWWDVDETAEEARVRHLARCPENADAELMLVAWVRDNAA